MRLHWNFDTLQGAFNYLDMYLSIKRLNHRDYTTYVLRKCVIYLIIIKILFSTVLTSQSKLQKKLNFELHH